MQEFCETVDLDSLKQRRHLDTEAMDEYIMHREVEVTEQAKQDIMQQQAINAVSAVRLAACKSEIEGAAPSEP